MTARELGKINRRIKEIDKVMDLCDERFDSDFIGAFEIELEQLVLVLETSLKKAKIHKSGLRLVHG